jgi:DNA processing protein
MGLDQSKRDWLALAMAPGVGTAYFIRLLARFRTPTNVLRASRAALEETVGRELAQRIVQYADYADIDAQERLMDQYGASLITLDDPNYPLRLAEIYDPPLAVFVRGQFARGDMPCIAVVGTRRASPYGIHMAETLSRQLASRGFAIVSGLATGIDAAAHRGALEAGGQTIAVLGNGVDVVYPAQNADLMKELVQYGCLLSQHPMGVKPSRGHFPYRNRIISGLCLGTVIVEAPLRSGALITARHAAEQGREVFAVPGQVGSLNSQGPHALIREGAKLVETVDDILVELDVAAEQVEPQGLPRPRSDSAGRQETESPPEPRIQQEEKTPEEPAPRPSSTQLDISPAEDSVLKALTADGSFVDEIAASSGLSISEALSSLTMLEIKGLVRQFSGKRFALR